MNRSVLTLGTALALLAPMSPLGAQEGEEDLRGIILDDPLTMVPRPTSRSAIAVPDTIDADGLDPELASTISQGLRHDLELSGYFHLLGPANLFFDQHADGMTESTINFENWFNAGTEFLVKTSIDREGDPLRLEFRLFDIDGESEIDLSGFGYSGARGVANPVRFADQTHDFANALIQYTTGFPGPFGGQVACVAPGPSGSPEVYGVTVGGTEMTLLTDTGAVNVLPSWSGNELLYTSYYTGNPDLIAGTGRDARILSGRPGINSGAALSPDGSTLALTLSQDGNTEIYLIDPSSGDILSRLTDHPAEDGDPAWSPDGSQIAFVSDRSGSPQIHVMNADGSGERRVTSQGGLNTTPDWSPDGRRIAFTGQNAQGRLDIYVVGVEDSTVERLTEDQGNNEAPSWSPDGQFLLFSSTRHGGGPQLYLANQENEQLPLSAEGIYCTNPAWRR
ncbi:MAG: PD40 domain-containing protein [Myxococcales bacterium]|nr:PD40 domain-containing protein [Myxococcales bacterium]